MVMQMLDVSTCHIKESTGRLLNNNNVQLIVYEKRGYGWFVVVPDESADLDERKIPDDLLNLIHYAKEKGCSWIMLDRDGDDIPELPSFDW